MVFEEKVSHLQEELQKAVAERDTLRRQIAFRKEYRHGKIEEAQEAG